MKLKVCGMKDPANMQELCDLQPDMMGLIFYEGSPRYFDGALPRLIPKPKLTGVFVNAGIREVLEKVEKYDLDLIQLHGEESPEYCRTLRTALTSAGYRCQLIKAFSIAAAEDLNNPERYLREVDLFLFDSKGKYRGGNGTTFNWEVLADYTLEMPYLLSGGIGAQNTGELRDFLATPVGQKCIGIDINSKFELAPGVKDIPGIRTFKEQLLP